MVDAIQDQKKNIMRMIVRLFILLVILAPAIYLALVWNSLPQQLAIHFDLTGKPDRMGDKGELLTAVLVLIVANIVSYFAITNIYRIDPKKYASDNRTRLYRIAGAIAVFLSAIAIMIISSSAQGRIRFSIGMILAATGLLFAFIGNYMPNLKPNYFAGIRLPWTLENEDNWRKTHLLAGKLWFAGGIALAVLCVFLPAIAAIVVFFVVMLVIVLIPCVYSYRLYKHSKL
jgi:uncharacterized membrane protein